jgi:hypothetical protein
LAQVNIPATFTIGSAVTVNDIKINLNGGELIIEGNASKLIVEDISSAATIEKVTVAAGATVTDSTIILNRPANALDDVPNNKSDQLIVKGILKNSTVVANERAAKTAIIKLAGKLDGVTFSCKIRTDGANGDGVCIEATAAAAQIINSKVDFEATNAAGTTPRAVDAGTNGVTIIGSTLKQIPAASGTRVFAVNHGGGALVVQNSTIDLNGNSASSPGSRAVNSTANSGSIILTGNVFKGYNQGGEIVVEIGGGLGTTKQSIVNNQFQITNPNTLGIKSAGAAFPLINLYATQSGNTFGSSSPPVGS